MSYTKYKFLEWAALNPVFWNDFYEKDRVVEAYYFNEKTKWENIHKNAWKVLNKCDKISFNADEVEAYGLFHFLDRYHRFQMIFGRLFQRGYFPTPKYPIDALDIGCGPAPSLFALDDFVRILKKYGECSENKRLQQLTIQMEYLERSEGFRSWLHRFQELTTSLSGKTYSVPFHNGSFHEFQGLDFRRKKVDYREWLIDQIDEEFWQAGEDVDAKYIVDHVETQWKHLFRYNMIIMSNFLTDPSDIDRFQREIISSVYALRNFGVLVIVSGATPKYEEIINKLNNLLMGRSFNTKRAKGRMYFAIRREKMIHNWNDLYGGILTKNLKHYMAMPGFTRHCPQKAKKIFTHTLSNGSINRWYLTVFQKRFTLKTNKQEA